MSEILFHYYRVPPTTWVYLSSLLMIGLFFKFSRLWSVRNLDLIGLVLLAPGLLLVEFGRNQPDMGHVEQWGYVWLFATGGFFLIRLLMDPMMVRRPLLEPNLSVGGLTFIGASLLMFLMANVVTGKPTTDDVVSAQRAVEPRATAQEEDAENQRLSKYGPGFPLLFYLPTIITQTIVGDDPATEQGEAPRSETRHQAYTAAARIMAILSHLAIVIAMIVIGYRHFDNIKTGIAASVLYLMLPYTALQTGHVSHVLPAALLIWAVEAYRRPLVAGMLMGLAIGSIYYPIFLLPLWCSFYWQRGLLRFAGGVLAMIVVLVGSLALTSSSWEVFGEHVQQMFGWTFPAMESLEGFWHQDYHDSVYRIPVLAAFVALCITMALWPAQKNLGTLLSCSAAIMLGTQYWHGHGGGLYMAWYLPLMLLTIFRPNLEDRVALSVLGQGWTPRRMVHLAGAERAA